jgi:hypothetical protein
MSLNVWQVTESSRARLSQEDSTVGQFFREFEHWKGQGAEVKFFNSMFNFSIETKLVILLGPNI